MGLKSNLVYKTMLNRYEYSEEQMLYAKQSHTTIMFMVMAKETLDELCELFPSSAELLKQRAVARRNRYMNQKLTNSKTFRLKLEKMTE